MKKLHQFLLTGALLAVSSAAAAQMSVAPLERGIANVLVKVGDNGTVKDFSVAEHFSPKMRRLLEETLKELVITPSPSSSSHRVDQVVLRFALKSTRLADGKYSVQFVAFDSKPVPTGSWYWSDNRQLALVSRHATQERPRFNSSPRPMRTFPERFSQPKPSQTTRETPAPKKS